MISLASTAIAEEKGKMRFPRALIIKVGYYRGTRYDCFVDVKLLLWDIRVFPSFLYAPYIYIYIYIKCDVHIYDIRMAYVLVKM